MLCATSTPNKNISAICREYDVPLYVNHKSNGIAADWNFALSLVRTNYATLAHQDDIYDPHFLEISLSYIDKAKFPLITFTDYYEIRDGQRITANKLLRIKRIMCLPWRMQALQRSRFVARKIFSFGNPVCCPSVTFVLTNLLISPLFSTKLKTNLDWLAWIQVRNLKGEFVYVPKVLMGHRIHAETETSSRIFDNTRSREDLKILQMLMPNVMARLIWRLYRKSQNYNQTVAE